MMIDRIAPEALKLPLEERIQLAASLWESIEDPYALAADREDEEAILLALVRDAEIESGKVAPISHSDLMRRLRK
ncbi:addiction module protein [Prosthecobacter dejongeii]|uniref:Putative addiction module component (TIGR02574 family) n=1 Tax=Prosthecobacter dejongeii TaxID=48465 RepID=A0A7W7YHQ2_9BACT|nr:addiction module protein [Prosthecobacter dejongeii]MBB5036388.1 putative addiction module component (TIGR02574 family) [Prosthecobacter dejongeii]